MKAVTFIFLMFISFSAFGQVAISKDNSSPDPSAILDLQSDSLGMLVPRMNTFERNSITMPATGLLVFDTNSDSFWYYNGSQWNDLGSAKIVSDSDGDTYIDPELTADNDRIYFHVGNTTAMIITKNSSDATRLELGADNTVIGTNAGELLTPTGSSTGIRNTFYGVEAGQTTGNGLNNVAIGHKALEDNTTGSQNTAVGMNSMANNLKGDSNVAIGQASLVANVLGSSNTSIGTLAGQNNMDDSNVFLGFGAGANSTGDKNICIGYQAGDNAIGGNKLYIHNKSSSFPLIYGEFENQLLRIHGTLDIHGNYSFPSTSGSSGSILVNTGPGNKMDWSSYYFPSTSGTAGQILTLNNSGYLLWQSPSVGTSIIDNDGNSKIEIEKFSNEDKMRVTLNNSEKLVLETSNNTTRLELKGQENVIIGQGAGLTNSANLATLQGVRNVYLGFEAGKSNSDGYGNTFVGYQAGEQSDGNVFATAVGWRAGWKTQGNFNAYFGRIAGFNNIAGEKNTFIGDGAGSASTGSGNVFLGFNAGENEVGDNKLYIDNSDTATPLLFGDFDTNTLTVNSNLFSPNSEADNMLVNDQFAFNTAFPNTYFHLNLPTDNIVGARMQLNGATKFALLNNGGLAIGENTSTTTKVPTNGLYVSGNVNLGTTTLHPTFRLQVDGKVACEEVNVELSQDWPDYVFKESYNRMSLEELQTYIEEKNHLPGIPSAQEVKDNGLYLGEMQTKMMEKIEELTLYVIEINAHNIELEKEIKLLKKANK